MRAKTCAVLSAVVFLAGLPALAQVVTVPRVPLRSPYLGDSKEYFLPLDKRPTIVVPIDAAKTLLPMELLRGMRMAEKFGDRIRMAVVFVGDTASKTQIVGSAIEQSCLLELGLKSSAQFVPLTDRTGRWYAELGEPTLPHAMLLGGDGTILGREILLGRFEDECSRIERALDPVPSPDSDLTTPDEASIAIAAAVRGVPLLPLPVDAARLPQRERSSRRVDATAIVAKLTAIDPAAALCAVRGYCESATNFSLAQLFAAAALERFGPEPCNWAQELFDSRIQGYCSVDHWQLKTALRVENPSPDLEMSVEVHCTLVSRWDGAKVSELRQFAMLGPGSDAYLTSDKFQTLNAGWGDYLVRNTIDVTMSEGQWPEERMFPKVTRTWTEAVTFLPRNEYATEDDADVANHSAATVALREALGDVLHAARNDAPAARRDDPLSGIKNTLPRFGQWLSSEAQRLMWTAALVGEPFPGLKISSWVQGQDQLGVQGPGTVASPAGRVLLVDFMFVECPPCQAALPELTMLHEDYRERGLVVLSVVISGGARGVFGLVERKNLKHPVAVLSEKEEAQYGVKAFPSYLLIDRRGKIRWAQIGKKPGRTLIESLLHEPP